MSGELVSKQTGEISTVHSFSDIEKMGSVIAASKLFGIQTKEQAIALMLIAQAEGRHPASVAQDYNIIQNKPALRSEAALRRFQESGGKVEWKERSDKVVTGIFTHPNSKTVEVSWDMARATKMGLASKDNWVKQAMVMLTWRVVAEGVRLCYPACLSGQYLVEEVQDFDVRPSTPVKTVAEVETVKSELAAAATKAVAPEKPLDAVTGAEDTSKTFIKQYMERAKKKGVAEEKELDMVIDTFLQDVVVKDFNDLTGAEYKQMLDTILKHYADKKLKAAAK